jgi:hypothetical protein
MLAAFLFLLPAAAAPAAVPQAVLVPVAPLSVAAPVTPELLERWSIPLDAYMALSPERKAQLRDDLDAGERSRLRRLELIHRIRPQDWQTFVDPKGFLTPDGRRLVEAYEASLKARGLAVPVGVDIKRADGKPMTAEDFTRARAVLDGVFDGTAALGPSQAKAGDELVFDARVRNETVRSVTVTNPKTGLSLEVGQLGVDGRTNLIAPSPYLNLTKKWESEPDSWVDYRVHAQIAYVDMKARFFNDGPDPRVGRMMDLAGSLGVSQSELDKVRSSLTYDDAYRAQGLVISSLLAQMGRAYHLGGPVDIAWSATSLTKMMHLAPNQAFDESAGFRVRLPGEELFVGVFAGAMQNISPIGNRVYQELMQTGTVKPGFNLENAPHWTTALWGRVPGMDDAKFSVSVGQRYNKDTTTSEAEVALMTSFRRVPVAVRGQYSRETGAGIEYDREKARLELDAQLSGRTQAYLAYERDRIRYGNAELNSNSVLAGISISLDSRRGGGSGGSRLTVDHLFGGEYETKGQPLRPFLPEATRVVTNAIADGVEAADKAASLANLIDASATPAQIDAGLNSLSLALSRLSPEAATALIERMGALPLSDAQKRLLSDALLRVVPAGSALDGRLRQALSDAMGPGINAVLARVRDGASRQQLLDAIHADAAHAVELLRLIGDQESWNAIAVAAGRHAMLEALSKGQVIQIPVLDRSITIQTHAPVIIAAMGALNSRLSPLAPVKEGDVEPWILRMAGDELGLPPGAVTSDMVAGRLIALGQQRLTDELDRRLAPAINDLVASGTYDRGRIASTVFGSLPPAAADALRARYGVNLEGLLPPAGATADQVRDFLKNRLGAELSSALSGEFKGAAARAVAEMTSWAADLLRRELNLATIQLMLAAEELDRLTVDHGRKAGDLGVEMIASSFEKLDARKRGKMSSGVAAVKREAMENFAEGERAFAARLTSMGRERLSEMTLDPSWPAGLSIAVADEQWAPLLSAYGDGAFFDLVARCAAKRRALGKTAPFTLTFEYADKNALGGTSIWTGKEGSLKISLSSPRDQRDADFRLRGLEDYLK